MNYNNSNMSDNFMEKVSSFAEQLKIGGAEVGRKVTAGMSSASFKMKEFFQGSNMADQIIEEATSETLDEPDWSTNLEICDMINHERVNSVEVIRGIKKRLVMSSPRVQYLAMVLLESIVKNCEKAFSDIESEGVLDDMVKVIDDPMTIVNNRNKALMLIEIWGESSGELQFLPIFENTYKSLKSRGIRFPSRDDLSLAPIFTPALSVPESESSVGIGQQMHHDIPAQTFTTQQIKEAFDVARNSIELLTTVLSSSPQKEALEDELTTTLVHQCHLSRNTVQTIIETAGNNEALLFEALNLNDEIHKILLKYEEMKKIHIVSRDPEPATITEAMEPENLPNSEMDNLEKMIMRGKAGDGSEGGQNLKKKQSSEDDMISF